MWSLCCLTLYYLSVRNLFEKWKRQTRTRILALSLLDASQKVEIPPFFNPPSEAGHISITFQKLFRFNWIPISCLSTQLHTNYKLQIKTERTTNCCKSFEFCCPVCPLLLKQQRAMSIRKLGQPKPSPGLLVKCSTHPAFPREIRFKGNATTSKSWPASNLFSHCAFYEGKNDPVQHFIVAMNEFSSIRLSTVR